MVLTKHHQNIYKTPRDFQHNLPSWQKSQFFCFNRSGSYINLLDINQGQKEINQTIIITKLYTKSKQKLRYFELIAQNFTKIISFIFKNLRYFEKKRFQPTLWFRPKYSIILQKISAFYQVFRPCNNNFHAFDHHLSDFTKMHFTNILVMFSKI